MLTNQSNSKWTRAALASTGSRACAATCVLRIVRSASPPGRRPRQGAMTTPRTAARAYYFSFVFTPLTPQTRALLRASPQRVASLDGLHRRYRPTVTATPLAGAVVAAHPLASMAGMQILCAGGNAIDAGIAVAAALGVVEPFMSGLGGGGWMQVYHAATGEHNTLNYCGRIPQAATLGPDGPGLTPHTQSVGPLSSVVPVRTFVHFPIFSTATYRVSGLIRLFKMMNSVFKMMNSVFKMGMLLCQGSPAGWLEMLRR